VPKPRVPSPVPKRSKAEKAAFRRRSDAAKRGWETRRKNALLQGDKSGVPKSTKLKLAKPKKRKIGKEEAKLIKLKEDTEKKLSNFKVYERAKPRKWEVEPYEAFSRFVFLRDMNSPDEETRKEMRKAHQEWYKAKMVARRKAEDWEKWMTMIGQNWRLPATGVFSIESFKTS
jgi:hypothetical protein